MFESVDSVPWKKVSHAFGRAVDAPRWIRALDSEDSEERLEAIYHFLWTCVIHQYTLYPATPLVIPFVIEALGSPTLAERDDGVDRPIKVELMDFLLACATGGQKRIYGKPFPGAPTIENAVAAEKQLYEKYANDENSKVRENAIQLLQFCATGYVAS